MTISIRALLTKKELIESYKFRYKIYQPLNYIQDNASMLDVDDWDKYSVPFGVFDELNRLIGYLRIITNALQNEYINNIEEIIQDFNINLIIRKNIFPSVSNSQIENCLLSNNYINNNIVEFSRFIIEPASNNQGLGLKIIDFVKNYAFNNGYNVYVASCLHIHIKMYKRYNFYKLNGIDSFYNDNVNQNAVVIVCVKNER